MSEQLPLDDTVDFLPADAPVAPVQAVNLPEKFALQLLDEIARGGMGSVLKGRDLDLGRDLAVKVLLKAHQGNPEMIQRFLEEARIAGQLQHPGVAPVHQLGVLPDGRPYFTMKLVKGQTLAALLASRKDVLQERPRFLGVFAQVCQTLAYAHAHRVIHRDLKPSNIMVGAFAEVQVMDWGLAKVLPQGGATEPSLPSPRADLSIISTQRGDGVSSAGSGSYTQAGAVLGTPAYIAPEQARGDVEQVDERADVFGVGAILCEILTGYPPYTGTGTELVYKARTAKLDNAFTRLETCGADEELIALAKRCLAAELQDRPRDACVVAMLVTDYQQSVRARLRQSEMERAAVQIKAQEERKQRKLTLALAASVLLTVLSGVGGWLWSRGQWKVQRAENNRAVAEALGQAASLRERAGTAQGPQALHLAAQAREQVRLAKALVESDLTDAKLEAKVRELSEDLNAEEKDRELLAALDTARLVQAETNREEGGRFALERAVPLYREAFRVYGMPAGEGDAAAAAKRLRNRPDPVRETVLAALDEWVAVAEHPFWKVEEAHLPWLRALLTAAEPEGWQKQVREAAAEKDAAKRREKLECLAATADVEHLPARALTRLAKRLQEVQAQDSAVALLRQAQVQHVGDFWINEELGIELWVYKHQPKEAVRYLMAAAALRPGSAAAYLNLGNALRDEGKCDEAVAQYRRAIALAPNFFHAQNNLANLLLAQGKRDIALVEYRKLLELTVLNEGVEHRLFQMLYPKNHDGWYIYAALCLYQGDKQAYRGCRRDMLARFKDTVDPLIADRTAKVCLLLPAEGEELKQALTLADRAVAVKPPDPSFAYLPYFQLCKGLAEYRQGRLDSAVAWLRKALSHPKGEWKFTVPAHLVLALAQHRRGEQEQAHKSLAAAVRIYDEQHPALAVDVDAWICQVLCREAESEIQSSTKKNHHESHE